MNESILKPAHLTFSRYIISECSWKFTGSNQNGELNINVSPKGIVSTVQKTFLLELDCNIKISGLFECRIVIEGHFGFNEFDSEGKKLCLNNAPALLFPHIRAYLSALTSLSGEMTVILPPMNVSGLTIQLEQNLQIDK